MVLPVEIAFNCEMLSNAVTVIMDPASTVKQRTEAQQFCDEFKEKSSDCVACGLKLAEKAEPTIVRHLGLQIIEHFVKCRWKHILRDERIYAKNRVMNLISSGMKPILEEEPCIKDAIARIVVEIAKHDWIRHWPKMLGEMRGLCQKGASSAELVMLILLRLSEDVVLFRELYAHARAIEIEGTLNQNMQLILSMIQSLLQEYAKMYSLMKHDPNQQVQVKTCCRVIVAAVNTLASYLEWCRICHINEKQYKVVANLWGLLNESELQLEAIECLLIGIKRIADRIGTKPLLVMFADSATPCILSSIQMPAGELMTEKRYFFLKKRCQLLCFFGEQLCRTMNVQNFLAAPSNFGKFLDCLLEFTTHNSQYLSFMTQATWRDLFNHERLRRNPLLLAMLPKYLLATRTNLVKVGFPSKNNSPSCEYSRFEFTTDEEFYEFLTTFRDEQRQTIDVACRLEQKTCFQMASECLKYQLSSSVDSESINAIAPDGSTCASSHSFLQWEAMAFFIKIIITNLFRSMPKRDIPVNDGIELLQLVLNFKTNDPLILACVQTNISTLFPFLKLKNDCLPQVLTKLLEIIEEVKAPKVQSLKNARRHACTCINQMCRDNGPVLVPNFEMLFNHVKLVLFDELLELTLMEKITLMEAMVFIINHLMDYEQQKGFLEQLMAPIATFWLSEEIERVFADPKVFVTFIGADLKSADMTVETPTDVNRSKILHCLATILGMLRWTRCPPDLKTAKAGGFVVGYLSSGKPICRNPCAEMVLKLLDNIFVLIRTQHNFYLPELLSKMGKMLSDDLVDAKNANMLEPPQPQLVIYDPPEYTTSQERIQAFFCTLYDTCLYILGRAGCAMKQDFYSRSNLVDRVLNCVFVNLKILPDHKVCSIVRFFLNPLVRSCPSDYYESCLSPILGPVLASIHDKLSHEWNTLDQLIKAMKSVGSYKIQKLPESCSTAPMKIQKSKITLLTKEVMEFIMFSCMSREVQDTVVTADESIDVCRIDADTVVIAETDDVCCVSRDVADVSVCTAESDDEDCVCLDDVGLNAAAAAAGRDDACYVPTEDADTSVLVTTESDDNCSLISEEDSSAVPGVTEDVCSLLNEKADTSVVSSDSDGELAAEVPQQHHSKSTEHTAVSEHNALTKLGVRLMTDEDTRSTLLLIAFSSLLWKSPPPHTTAKQLCWPLLNQVISEPLPAESVKYYFTVTLNALSKYTHDKPSTDALFQLGLRIYQSLRPRYTELFEVMKQVPRITRSYLDNFDQHILHPTHPERRKILPFHFRRLILGCVSRPIGEQSQQEGLQNDPLHPSKKSLKRESYYKMMADQHPFKKPKNPPQPKRRQTFSRKISVVYHK